MKLLYVFPEPLPLARARGIQVAYTLRAVAERGIAIVLAHVPAQTPSDGDPFGACGIDKPANVELLPVSHRLPWPLARVHSNRIFDFRLAREVNWKEIGTVMARHLKVARLLLERRPALPLVYEAHEVFADTASAQRAASVAELEQFVIGHAALLVANSAATALRLRERYSPSVPIEVVPNGVDYPESLPEKDWGRIGERIVYAGSFFGWKGVDDLVEASRSLPGLRITLMGGDEAGIARLRLAAGSGGAALEFTGRVPHQRVAAELARACIAVLPNRAEPDSAFTSPIKLFEYMAAGCALVASDLPSVREILAEDEVVWVPPGSPKALAQAIRTLARDPARARAMALRVREKARRYTWEARGERLAGLLRPLLQR